MIEFDEYDRPEPADGCDRSPWCDCVDCGKVVTDKFPYDEEAGW